MLINVSKPEPTSVPAFWILDFNLQDTHIRNMTARFATDDLLNCYRRGVFPMGDSKDDPSLFLIDPETRGVIPLDHFHIPRRLRRTVRQDIYRVSYDTAFTRVMEGCAETKHGRESTWINSPILNLYSALHRQGAAHSVECWLNDQLVGGLYGVSINGAFFGESMFSRARDASKVALVHLVARLLAGGYTLLDAQFHNPHLEQFGLEEIPRAEFKKRLSQALDIEADFYSEDGVALTTGSGVLQRITQTS